jgi:hypothetical protein
LLSELTAFVSDAVECGLRTYTRSTERSGEYMDSNGWRVRWVLSELDGGGLSLGASADLGGIGVGTSIRFSLRIGPT